MTKYTNPLHPTLTNQPKQDWGRLYGSSIGLAISQAAQKKPLIIITPDSLTAQRLLEDIKFYAKKDLPLFTFPDWETLPYDMFSPHQDIISDRLTTLYHLPDIETGVLVLPVSTLMYRIAPTDYVRTNSLLFTNGQLLNPAKLRQRLEANGYCWTETVEEHGQFLIRGSKIDLFPMGCDIPYRIDLFDNEIENIWSFDPESQRSISTIEELRLLPARELPLSSEAISHFQNQWHEQLTAKPSNCPMYQDIVTGLAPAGIEYYLPLFFNKTSTLFDYLPANSTIATLAGTLEAAEQFWKEINERYEQLRHDIERPILPPTKLFLQANEAFANLSNYAHIKLNQEPTDKSTGVNFATQAPSNLPVDSRAAKPLSELQNFLDKFSGRVLLVAETAGRREILLETLHKYNLKPKLVENWWKFVDSKAVLCMTVAPLEHGLLLEGSLAVITETQLFGERVAQRRRRKKKIQRDADAIVRDLTELTISSPIVHEEYGVGRYHGLVTLTIGGMEAEFLQLEYAKQDKLYVPVSSLHLISRFTGMDPEHAPLHRLGTSQWEKARQKAIKKVTDVAAELLDVYAQREAKQGQAFEIAAEDYQAFAQTFPFEETPDQQEAITEVLNDMAANKPMDRLVCGDVGFGKTEVAMRAALIAVLNGQQVAILVPTTLLCQQHYQTFQDRFAEWPVIVKQLSRFISPKKQKETTKAIKDGQVDIIIGTHKLLNIKFNKLGLVIIDEEHRFGVRQKDRFKSLRAEVDILTLTATPIPRSLNMSLSNLRDLSIISTPPAGRLAIKTFIREWQNHFISEAILRELKRGGQVFFLHNNVDTIKGMAINIQELVPEVRVQIGHGQMREKDLEQVMQDFYHRRFNVLVCTTIIETGIDIPTANTIIINRADKLGLAQLYQLRGRVGRSHHRAYAYLIVPARKSMTKDARRRIDAIEALDEVGMGFNLATQDLEIRGAGELLGDEQSGFVQEIGYNLYTDLLERAVTSIKSGQPLAELVANNTEIDLHVPTLLPETYLYDIHTRLIMYKRIANASDIQALDDIQVEMIDRFGLLPEYTKNLLTITELKLKAMSLGIRKIDFGEKGGSILFMEKTPVSPEKIITFIQNDPAKYQLQGESKINLLVEITEFKGRCLELEQLFKQLR
ncbi:transcription-repair coupling factor [Candidatus Halobeggiatoa sp. HSG11]|nr:transcription-repair coupling factor [Candidatus Halobeggiatoa sp. HSG11]